MAGGSGFLLFKSLQFTQETYIRYFFFNKYDLMDIFLRSKAYYHR